MKYAMRRTKGIRWDRWPHSMMRSLQLMVMNGVIRRAEVYPHRNLDKYVDLDADPEASLSSLSAVTLLMNRVGSPAFLVDGPIHFLRMRDTRHDTSKDEHWVVGIGESSLGDTGECGSHQRRGVVRRRSRQPVDRLRPRRRFRSNRRSGHRRTVHDSGHDVDVKQDGHQPRDRPDPVTDAQHCLGDGDGQIAALRKARRDGRCAGVFDGQCKEPARRHLVAHPAEGGEPASICRGARSRFPSGGSWEERVGQVDPPSPRTINPPGSCLVVRSSKRMPASRSNHGKLFRCFCANRILRRQSERRKRSMGCSARGVRRR